MQSDSSLPVEQQRNYRHVFHAFSSIIKEEGFLSCWKGCTPTVVRAMVLNLGMLATYEEAKERLGTLIANQNLVWFLASLMSGGVASTMSLPLDNIKTKLQKMTVQADGTMPYNGMLDCAKKTIAREGITGFWAGLPTFIVRISPHIMIVSIFKLYILIIITF